MRIRLLIPALALALALPTTASASHRRHHATHHAARHVHRHTPAHKAETDESSNAAVEALWTEECGPLFDQLGAEGKEECAVAAEYGMPW